MEVTGYLQRFGNQHSSDYLNLNLSSAEKNTHTGLEQLE